MTKKYSDAIVKIGDIGERLVYDLLKIETPDVQFSEDRYDSVKDIVAAKKTVEVKTLVPIRIYNAFAVGSNQIVKCLNADRLFFVEISRSDDIRIFESHKPRRPFSELYNGDTCYFFKLTDLKLYDTIHSSYTATRLRKLSPSKYL